jgi:hypothetical protein
MSVVFLSVQNMMGRILPSSWFNRGEAPLHKDIGVLKISHAINVQSFCE